MAWEKDVGWQDGAVDLTTIDAVANIVAEAVEVLRHRAGQEGCWDCLWKVRGMHICPVFLSDLDWKSRPSFLTGTAPARRGGGTLGLGACWVGRITASTASRAGVLRKPPQRCPEKGNGNGLRNLKSTHNCFKNLVAYFQHIPAASDAAIGLPKLSFISLLQCNEGLLPQLARF